MVGIKRKPSLIPCYDHLGVDPHLGDSWCAENVADHREPPQEADNDREKVTEMSKAREYDVS